MGEQKGGSGKGAKKGTRTPRTAKDRARDRALLRAIGQIGDAKQPVIVRIGTTEPPAASPKTTSPGRHVTKTATRKEPTNPAIAEAFLAAGLVKPEKQTTAPKTQKKSKQGVAKSARHIGQKKYGKAARARELAAIERERQARARELKRELLAGLRTRASAIDENQTPEERYWRKRQGEIADLVEGITKAPFSKLADEWKKHLRLAGHIEETGRYTDRLPVHKWLIGEIEQEWGRRAKLNFSSETYFDWPTTRVGKSRKRLGEIDWVPEGFLSYLGYHVGESSTLTEHARHAILRRAFAMILPPLESPEYVQSCGPPSSAARLKKMADSLAANAKNRKRHNTSSYALAISQWETDLGMLYDEFYVGKFGFAWPKI